MDKKTIEEQTLLALFEGAIKEDHCHYMIPALNRIVWVEKMLYSSDWNWIMRIVDKIESLDNDVVFEAGNIVIITHLISTKPYKVKQFSCTKMSKIEAVYTACIDFIQWYNVNLKQDESN